MISRTSPLLAILVLFGCRPHAVEAPKEDHKEPPSNRIAVPDLVRKNLGIEFVKVARQRVAATLRVPGHYELLPSARREYRTPVSGRVELVAKSLGQVRTGDLLYKIASPEWRRTQNDISELGTTITQTQARTDAIKPLLAAHKVHRQSMVEAIAVIEQRMKSLETTRESVGGQAAELAATAVQLARIRSDLAEVDEKEAQTEATFAELQAAHRAGQDRLTLALESAATLLGTTRQNLLSEITKGEVRLPTWRAVDAIEVRAVADGIAATLPVASGAWVAIGDLVVATSDVTKLRFRARALQSDLGRLRSGLPCRATTARTEPATGALILGVEADPAQRTVDLFLVPDRVPEHLRPGVAGFLEVELESSASPELVIPLSAVMQDGLQRVVFRRDPKDHDTVIRIEADLGRDDGKVVEVQSGFMDGDEIVLAGAYELMLASSGSVAKGGHFHADGTFHPSDHK